MCLDSRDVYHTDISPYSFYEGVLEFYMVNIFSASRLIVY